MAAPVIRVPHKVEVKCCQPFHITAEVTAYGRSKIKVCCIIPEESECFFVVDGDQSRKVCKTIENPEIQRMYPVTFDLHINCDPPGQYYGVLMDVVATTAEGESCQRSVQLRIDCEDQS